MAKSTVGTYKHTVWKSCALFIKLRDCDPQGYVRCCTCSKVLHIYDQECQAGHFVPGRGNVVLYDAAHIFPQCSGCNCDGGGEQYKFGLFLKERYGYSEADIDEIRNMRHQSRQYKMWELKEIKKRFDDEIVKLIKEKGIPQRKDIDG